MTRVTHGVSIQSPRGSVNAVATSNIPGLKYAKKDPSPKKPQSNDLPSLLARRRVKHQERLLLRRAVFHGRRRRNWRMRENRDGYILRLDAIL